tara:strand:+ start:1058 stop:1894 length:837 start_codon:yes stop_codon:yes gene_type:complete
MENNIIGIVGQGFVGSALREGLKKKVKIETYDLVKESTCESLEELCSKANIIFVCVPTPMNEDGSCNVDNVWKTVLDINQFSNGQHIVVIKSTVTPGTTQSLNGFSDRCSVVFSPEFLTEKNHIEDYKNQNRIIFGGDPNSTQRLTKLFQDFFPKSKVISTDSTTAEMVKYFANCFLAVKVSFSNEMKQLCDKMSIDYNEMIECVVEDKRIGKTHFAVPGPDEKLGFGGSCFPKDINAMMHFCLSYGVDPLVLKAAWEKNLEVRPERDWEKLKGRAVL